MLKISVSEQDPSFRIIKLEGKLLHAWVDEMRRVCVEAEDGSLSSLDLSGLSFVDRRGAEMLQQLLRQGVRIHACSPFMADLLHRDRKPNPQSH
jgi:anti-anti-sigma regulatory factor